MRQVLLAGAFGQGNPGDDALLEAFAAALPGYQVVAPCDDPDAVPAAVAAGIRLVPKSARVAARELMRSAAVVYGGGTVFKQLDPGAGRRPADLLVRACLLARAARLTGKPVAVVGVGAGALRGSVARRLARSLAATAQLVVVRDEESAAALAAVGARPVGVGADAVWTLLDGGEPVERTDGRLVITVSRHAGGPRAAAASAESVAAWVRTRPDITAVHIEPWQLGGAGTDDRSLAAAMQGAFAPLPIPCVLDAPPQSVPAAAERYRGASLVLGQRFHSLVAAAAAGCRFVAVAHEAKLAALARRLGQRALPEEAADLAAVLDAALDGPPPARIAVEAERAAAEEMLAGLRAFLRSALTS